jgi:Flp pilus assembly protein TadB
MTAALLTAFAVWCALPPSARPRARRVLVAPVAAPRIAPSMVAAALVPVATVVLLGVVWGLVLGAFLAPMAHRAVGRLETAASRQRAARLAADLPGALDLVVAALLAGRPSATAFALAAEATSDPLGSELGVLAGRLAIAADPDTVWSGVTDDPALAPVGRAFRRASVSGMPVAEIVGSVADELRRDRAAQLRERSQRVGVRTAAPLGLCFLPAFFLIGIVPAVVASFSSLSW